MSKIKKLLAGLILVALLAGSTYASVLVYNATYSSKQPVLHLPMHDKQDGSGVEYVTSDVTSNHTDFTLGDGSTSSSYPTWNEAGEYYSYDGGDYLELSQADYRSSDTQGSISVWFDTSSATSGTLFSSSDEASGTRSFRFTLISTGGIAIIQRNNDTTDDLRATATVQDGNLHNAVLTSDGSTYKIYLDNQELSLSPLSGSNTGDWLGDTSARDNVIIGGIIRDFGFESAGSFTGNIYDVKYYDDDLSVMEIEEIYNQGKNWARIKSQDAQTVWREPFISDANTEARGGVIGGTPTIGSGAYYNDGTDANYITYPNDISKYTEPATFAFTVKSTLDDQQAIIDIYDGADDRWSVLIGDNVTGTLTNELITITAKRGATTWIGGYTTATRTELLDGEKHKIVITMNGVVTKLYLDGVEKTLTTGVFGGSGPDTGQFGSETTDTFVWGRAQSGTISLTGTIYDPIIANKVWSADEIAAYNAYQPKLIRIQDFQSVWREPFISENNIDARGGTINGTPTISANTYTNDGTAGNYIYYPNNSKLSGTVNNDTGGAPSTLAFEYKGTSDVGQAILSFRQDGSNFHTFWVGNNVTGTLTDELITVVRTGAGITQLFGGYETSNRNELLDGEWHKVILTFNDVSTKIYIDGVEKTLTIGTGTDKGAFGLAGATNFNFGSTDGTASPLNGSIRNISISNKVWSANEIAAYQIYSH